jgi:putative hemolysin
MMVLFAAFAPALLPQFRQVRNLLLAVDDLSEKTRRIDIAVLVRQFRRSGVGIGSGNAWVLETSGR